MFDYFVGLALKGVNYKTNTETTTKLCHKYHIIFNCHDNKNISYDLKYLNSAIQQNNLQLSKNNNPYILVGL